MKLFLLIWAIINFLFISNSEHVVSQVSPKTTHLYLVEFNGDLKFPADSKGYRIPDFSHAGYKNSNQPLPELKNFSHISIMWEYVILKKIPDTVPKWNEIT